MGFKVETEIGEARLEVSEDGKNVVLRNAVLLYTSIAQPYKGKFKPQFRVSVPISALTKREVKKLAAKISLKECATEEFCEEYKVDEVPFPKQDEQVILTLAKKAVYADGNPLKPEHRPRLLKPIGNGKVKDISKTMLSNGSIGDVYFHIVQSDENGSWLDLDAIVVKKLVEYEGKGPGAISQFDIEGELETFDTPQRQQDDPDEIPF